MPDTPDVPDRPCAFRRIQWKGSYFETMNTQSKSPGDVNLIHACLEGRSDAQSQLYNLYFTQDKPVHFWVYQKAYWIPAGEKEDAISNYGLDIVSRMRYIEGR